MTKSRFIRLIAFPGLTAEQYGSSKSLFLLQLSSPLFAVLKTLQSCFSTILFSFVRKIRRPHPSKDGSPRLFEILSFRLKKVMKLWKFIHLPLNRPRYYYRVILLLLHPIQQDLYRVLRQDLPPHREERVIVLFFDPYIHLPELDKFCFFNFHGWRIMNFCHFTQRHEISKYRRVIAPGGVV